MYGQSIECIYFDLSADLPEIEISKSPWFGIIFEYVLVVSKKIGEREDDLSHSPYLDPIYSILDSWFLRSL